MIEAAIHPTIKRLEALLEEREMSKTDFCNAVGETTQNYNNWRTRGIPAAKMKTVAEALEVSRDWLEGFQAGMVANPTLPYNPIEARRTTERMITKALLINGASPKAMDHIDDFIHVLEPAVTAVGDTAGMQETINRYIAEAIKQTSE